MSWNFTNKLTFAIPNLKINGDLNDQITIKSAEKISRVSQPDSFRIEIGLNSAISQGNLKLSSWLGMQGILYSSVQSSLSEILWVGVIRKLNSVSDNTGSNVGSISLVLEAWPAADGKASFSRRYQFYTGMTSVAIAEKIFTGAGGVVRQSDKLSSTLNSLPERFYCVQYGESDSTFIKRILSEDSIAYKITPSPWGKPIPPNN